MNEATAAAVYGIILGLGYGVSSYLTFLWAMKRPGNRFFVIALGGMLVRMVLASVAVVAMTVWLSIPQQPFFLGFAMTFMIVLTVEVAAIHKGVGIDDKRKPSNGTTT